MNLGFIPPKIGNLEFFPGEEFLAPDNRRGDSIVSRWRVFDESVHHRFAEDGLDYSQSSASGMWGKVLQYLLEVISSNF